MSVYTSHSTPDFFTPKELFYIYPGVCRFYVRWPCNSKLSLNVEGPSVINDICEKRKRVVWESGGFWPISFLEKMSVSGWHRMRSTFVKPPCTALSSSFDAHHFRQVYAQHFRCAALKFFCFLVLTASDTPWCSLHMTCASGKFHIHVCTMIILTLAVHVFCEHAIETNTDKSHCLECMHIICVRILSPENIGPVYKHTCSFWGRGWIQKNWGVLVFFLQISVITDGP